MRTCNHCYKQFELTHICGAKGVEVRETDEADVSALVPTMLTRWPFQRPDSNPSDSLGMMDDTII